MSINYQKKYLKYKMKYSAMKELIGGYIPSFPFPFIIDNYDYEHALTILNKDKQILEKELINFINLEIDKFIKENNLDKTLRWEWTKIKKAYLTTNPTLMKKFILFRQNIVDTLLKNIFKYYECTDSCIIVPSGSTGESTTLSSDYDLTLTAKLSGIYLSGKIIRIYNSVIRDSMLGRSNDNLPSNASAFVFDTNLYAYGPMYRDTIAKHLFKK